jgi:glycine oxidase
METQYGMKSSYDLAVVGGGVIGLSIAAQCAKNGWRVCVIDRGTIGKESSWAGAGILPAGASGLADDPIEQLRQLSDTLHEQWAKWLYELTRIDTEYQRCGGLYIARSPAERATMRANCLWWQELGIEYEPWSIDQVTSRCPMLEPGGLAPGGLVPGGLVPRGLVPRGLVDPSAQSTSRVEFYWVQRDAQVRNPLHLIALKAACKTLGVCLIEQAKELSLQADGTSIQSIAFTPDEPGSRLKIVADRVCLATGAWTGPLLKTLGIETGIYPVRGQMQLYRFDRPPFACVVNEGFALLQV